MRKEYLFYTFALFSMFLLASIPGKTAHADTKMEVMSLVRRIIQDPMVPREAHEAKISANQDHKPSKEEPWESYDLIAQKKNNVGSLSVFERSSGIVDFGLYFENLHESANAKPVTDWDEMVPKWDAFVEQYWPGLHRISDWKNEIWRRSGSGTFTIQYVLTKEKLEVFTVVLNIRLSDGKIAVVSTMDKRGLLNNSEITPAPSDTQIFQAVRKALKEKKDGLSKAKLAKSEVRRDIFVLTDGKKLIIDNGNLWMLNDQGETYIIAFSYSESLQEAFISNVTTQKELDDFRQKPLTQIDDKKPSWSVDGKQLYFVTTRDAKDRGWWNRGTLAFQYALAVNQVGTDNLQYISPLKTKHGDYGLYNSPEISPDGRYLAAGLGNNKGYLFILDMQKGILHIPERDPAYLVRQQNKMGLPDTFLRMTQSMFRSDGNKYPWISKGFQWLPNGDFLYVGWLNGESKQIFLGRKTTADPGQTWDVWPVHQGKGEDVELCLSSDEKVLSWAHLDPPPPKQNGDTQDNTPPQQWHFITADFDATKPDVSNLIQTDLPEEPVSISWDSKNKRWLIVTKKNNLLWIEKKGDKLTTTKVLLPLIWNKTQLRPTSAAVSPDGSQIALAAELEKPIAYSKTECVVHSMIFNWDGKSTSVKPFYDPSINGIPRYTFPTTNSPWAKVEGNLKKFGLQNTVDPNFIESSSALPKAVTK